MLQFPTTLPLRQNPDSAAPFSLNGTGNSQPPYPSLHDRGSTEELREKFTQFVGEAFYGQMFKAMRSTVGKPAYFHGGRAEEDFPGQLDQTMAEQLTKTTASKFADPMFERQFPRLAKQQTNELGQIAQLRRL